MWSLIIVIAVLGPFLLTNLLLDKLKSCAPSRVITVTSIVYKKGRIEFDNLNSVRDYESRWAYMQSKLANVLFSVELARRLQGQWWRIWIYYS